MNPGTATFGSEGIVKPKELFVVRMRDEGTLCIYVCEYHKGHVR